MYVPLLLIYQSHIYVFSIPFPNTHVYHTVLRIFGGIILDIILEFLELFIGGGCTRITQWLSLCFSTGERCTHLSISVSYLGKQMFVVSFVYFHWQNIADQWLGICFQQYHSPWWALPLVLILCTYQGCYLILSLAFCIVFCMPCLHYCTVQLPCSVLLVFLSLSLKWLALIITTGL